MFHYLCVMDLLITYRHTIGFDLKYCLRSIDKYAKGIDKIYIIGDFPNYLKESEDLIHLPITEPKWLGDNKCAAVWYKLHQACKDERISEKFVQFSDDYFLTKEVDFETYKNKRREYPLSHMADGTKILPGASNGYIKLRRYTSRWLKTNGYKDVNYDLHQPMIFEKSKLITISDTLSWRKKNITGDAPYALKSCYGNFFNEPCEKSKDVKILFEDELEDNPRFQEAIFSIGDFVFTPETCNIFKGLYPEKSKWEVLEKVKGRPDIAKKKI